MKRQPGNEKGTFEQACERAAQYANRHGGSLQRAEEFIGRAGWLHATFGIEYASVEDRELAYLNTGDTYSLTVGCEGGKCFATTWGDWFESAEQEHEAEEGVIRCGYCSHFTDHPDGVEWRDVVCESCGNCVAG